MERLIIGISVAVFLSLPWQQSNADAGLSTQSGGQTLQFIVIGDWGMYWSQQQKRVAGAMEQLAAKGGIDFIISTGDNFYPKGVQSSADKLWRKSFESVYSLPHLKNAPWYVVLGNHDYMGEYHAQIEYGKQHPNWVLPNNYYQQIKIVNKSATVQFIFLDTSVFVNKYRIAPDTYRHILAGDPDAQINWLKERLAEQHQWRIVIGHHPVYSSGLNHGGVVELRTALIDLFEQYGVNAYFAGHDHHLEHYKSSANTHYFISGAGAHHRRVRPGAYTQFSAAEEGFAHVVLDDRCMEISFVSASEEILYKTVLPAQTGIKCH